MQTRFVAWTIRDDVVVCETVDATFSGTISWYQLPGKFGKHMIVLQDGIDWTPKLVYQVRSMVGSMIKRNVRYYRAKIV